MSNQHWEYHVEQSDKPLSESHLNELGAQGWELTAALPTAGHFIFKRLAPDLRERITQEQRDTLMSDQDSKPTP